jgi:hypothetical protein
LGFASKLSTPLRAFTNDAKLANELQGWAAPDEDE